MGDWLPEPLVESPEGDPAQRAEMLDSLSFAFLAVLERLSPEQRAVLLLRDVFGYEYDEIAEILDLKAPNVRQLAVRARRHVREERPRFAVSRRQHERLASGLLRGGRARRSPSARVASSPRTSCCVATAAARHPRWGTRSSAAPTSRAPCWPGRGSGGTARRRDPAGDGQRRTRRARLDSGRPADWRLGNRHRGWRRSAGSPPSSTPTSCGTSRPSDRWSTPCAAFATAAATDRQPEGAAEARWTRASRRDTATVVNAASAITARPYTYAVASSPKTVTPTPAIIAGTLNDR